MRRYLVGLAVTTMAICNCVGDDPVVGSGAGADRDDAGSDGGDAGSATDGGAEPDPGTFLFSLDPVHVTADQRLPPEARRSPAG